MKGVAMANANVLGENVRVSLNVVQLTGKDHYMDVLDRIAALSKKRGKETPKVIQILAPDHSGNRYAIVLDCNIQGVATVGTVLAH